MPVASGAGSLMRSVGLRMPMKLSEHLKFSASGFSAKRVAYSTAALGFATVPLQFSDNWRVGGAAFGFSLLLVCISGLLCFVQPRGTPKRFHPVAWSAMASIAHMLCTHL
jgi:hypothetical protein